MPTIQVQGTGVVTADFLNSLTQNVLNIATLRTFTGLDAMVVFVEGYVAPNDGGAGNFYYNASSTATDDSVNVVVPTGNVQGAWLRVTVAASVPNPLTLGVSLFLQGDGTNGFIRTLTAGTLNFGTNNTNRAFIDENGNFRPVADNVYTLGSLGNRWTIGWFSSAVNVNNMLLQGDGTDGFIRPTNGGSSLFLGSAGSNRVQIDPSGNMRPAVDNAYACGGASNRWTAVWAANGTIQTSDQNAKTDIVDSPLGLEFICKLRPVAYRFKVGGNKMVPVSAAPRGRMGVAPVDPAAETQLVAQPVPGKRQHFGLLAQELKAALPPGLDFGGWVKTDTADPNSQEGLRYDELIGPLIKAVQELRAQVDTLTADLLKLKEPLPPAA